MDRFGRTCGMIYMFVDGSLAERVVRLMEWCSVGYQSGKGSSTKRETPKRLIAQGDVPNADLCLRPKITESNWQ